MRHCRQALCGETYAYWYLRHLGHIFIAMPEHAKGELDLISFDEDTLALIELSITQGKHETVIRTALYFLRERHIKECPLRFDVVAIDNTPGHLRLFAYRSLLSVLLSIVIPIASSLLVDSE